MKKLPFIFLLFSGIEKASAFNSGLNIELSYIYITFIVVVLLILGVDKGIKFVHKKRKEHEEKLKELTPIEPLE